MISKRLRLNAYKKALKDWEGTTSEDTMFGFCSYFEYKGFYSFRHDFPELFAKGEIFAKDRPKSLYQYPGGGFMPLARQLRVDALKEVIREMEGL
jgi:hypothetical protein